MGKDSKYLLESACQTLRRHKLKLTRARVRLLRFLIGNHGPFSMEDIQSRLSTENVDRVTLYRNLATFEETGLVHRMEFGDGVSRYEFQGEGREHHHHIRCVECQKVVSLSACELQSIEKAVERMGYSQIKHSLVFYGVCGKCNGS